MTVQHRICNDEPRIFRLVHPDDELSEQDSTSGLSPNQTLRQFFEDWYKPIVLLGQGNDSQSTIALYENALTYWERLTTNPTLRKIDEFVIAEFTSKLRGATFKRGIVGAERTLSDWTVAKHLKNIRAILGRVGPTMHPRRPAKGLVAEVPYIAIKTPQQRQKPSFTFEAVRKIVAAARDITIPTIPGIPGWRWWVGVLSGFFYTGLRAGTIFALRWEWLEEREDGWWLAVPAGAVKKTHKSIDVPVHPALLQSMRAMRTSDSLIYPRPFCYEYFCDLHRLAQNNAGIVTAKQLSPQAWRRTHGNEMLKLGARFGVQVAQATLDHADSKTTLGHYVTLAGIMRQLPVIADLDDDPRQGKLF